MKVMNDLKVSFESITKRCLKLLREAKSKGESLASRRRYWEENLKDQYTLKEEDEIDIVQTLRAQEKK